MDCLRYLFIILIINLSPFYSSGQINAPSDQSVSFLKAKEYYQNTIGGDSHIYTGEAYYGYNSNIKGTPFFISDSMQPNDIFYDGNLYKNVPLLFDIVKQKVVITKFESNERIQLVNAKIKYFTYDGHKFENFLQQTSDGNISANMYEDMFNGKASVLIKRIKRIKESIRAEGQTSFIEEDEIFVKKENNLFEIKNKKSVFDAFADKEKLVKSYIRKKKFRFKKNIEKELVATAVYYETLNN
jgi:hypothetical protein